MRKRRGRSKSKIAALLIQQNFRKRRKEMEDQMEKTDGRTKTGKWVTRIVSIAFSLLMAAVIAMAIYRKYIE
jgi:hypothetical protein